MNSLIGVLVEALKQDPDNLELRQHLATAYVQHEEWAEALEQLHWLLGKKPGDTTYLEQAAQACQALGQTQQAEVYRSLMAALATTAPDSTATPPAEGTAPEQQPAPVSKRPHLEPGPYRKEPDGDEPFSDPSAETSTEALTMDETPEEDSEPVDWENDPEESNIVRLKAIRGGIGDTPWQEELSKVNLSDVAGMDTVKQRLQTAFLMPMKNPDMMKLYGMSLRGGLLLYGPPGCGKTYIARATAGELGARFVHVGIADVLDMYIGQSERNLRDIFAHARRKAPCVLFFDELDALGRKRSLQRDSYTRDAVNQLLSELDHVASSNEGVFVLAATNHPWDIDTALRRPGRLDRMLLVLPPDREARLFLIKRHFEERPHHKLDFDWLANKTEGYSGADIVHLCESAAEQAMVDSITSGKPRPIGKSDCKRALKDVKPSTRPWFETAKNFATFANEGGTYDELLDYLRAQRII